MQNVHSTYGGVLFLCYLLFLSLGYARETSCKNSGKQSAQSISYKMPSCAGMQELIKALSITAQDTVYISAPDTLFMVRLEEAYLQNKPSVTTSSKKTQQECPSFHQFTHTIPTDATVIVVATTELATDALLTQIAALPDGTRVLLRFETDEFPALRLQSTHAIAVSPTADILFYEYQVRALTVSEHLETLYMGQSGFCIGQKEAQNIRDVGGDPTYGEITFASTEKLFTELVPLTAQDVFYDLGAGIGRLALWVHLATPVKKVVGVELSTTRYNIAQKMAREIKKKEYAEIGLTTKLTQEKSLSFILGDIAEVPLDDATLIFMCATCFSESFIAKMADIFANLKPGVRIVTLKELPPHSRIVHIGTYTLAMTWSPENGSAVYVYEIKALPQAAS